MLLALDTATNTASLAVYDLGAKQLLAETTWQARRRQSQEIFTAAQRLLAQVQQESHAISALAVTTGPGSFTGVRIAISAAKGISIGLPGLPRVIGIPTLTVTAAPWLAAAASVDVLVCAYIQAGRGRYNWCVFAPKDAQTELLRRPEAHEHGAGRAQDFAEFIAGQRDSSPAVWLVGELNPELNTAMGQMSHVTLLDEVSGLRRAGQLARVAAEHLDLGIEDDLKTLQPLYLRPPG